MAAHPLAMAQLPAAPGLYRVRRVDRREELTWIAWTQQGVRETVERLSRQVHLPVPPYDDPRGPASLLWHMWRSSGAGFEVSGATLAVSSHQGRAREKEIRAAYRRATGNPDVTHLEWG